MRFNKQNFQNIIYIILTVSAVYVMIFWFLSKNNIVINWTPSHVPVGLYQVIDTPNKNYTVGDIALFNIDELYQEFPALTDTQSKLVSRMFIKVVGAIAGDQISKVENKVTINGKILQNAVIHTHYHNGETRCKIQYPLTIPSGHVWLITDTEFSFDSRYFGPVPENLISARVKEFWTWNYSLRLF